MNELSKIFKYAGNEVRTVVRDGDVWFVAKDVCDVLEIANVGNVVAALDNDEKDKIHTMDSIGRMMPTPIINESGLYELIFKSRKPEAKAFKRWVTREVLPTIRKTGGYVANDDLFIQTYLPFADDQTKLLFSATLETVRKQNEQLMVMKPKADQHDRFISGGNLQTLGKVAKTLGIGRNKLSAFLKAVNVFTQQDNSPVPYQRFINEGYFEVKQTPSFDGLYNNVQTYVTARGVTYIDKLLEKHGGANFVNSMLLKEIKEGFSGYKAV